MFVGHLWSSIAHMMLQGQQQMDEDVSEKLESHLRLVSNMPPDTYSPSLREENTFAVISNGEPSVVNNDIWIGVIYRDPDDCRWHAWMCNVYCGMFDTRGRAANNVSVAYFG